MDKLKDIAPGDRVRVTLEGVVDRGDGLVIRAPGSRLSLILDQAGDDNGAYRWFSDEQVSATSFHIERIEETITAGNAAQNRYSKMPCRVIAVDGDEAWVCYDRAISRTVLPVSDLERVK